MFGSSSCYRPYKYCLCGAKLLCLEIIFIFCVSPQILFDQAQRSVQSALRAFLSGYVMPLDPLVKNKLCIGFLSPAP